MAPDGTDSAASPAAPDIAAMQRQMASLQAQLDAALAAQTALATQTGTTVGGSVNTAGGQFVGRDLTQYITQIMQAGDDPQEVNSVIAAYLNALVSDLGTVRLGEIDTSFDPSKQSPLQLTEIYVPLDTELTTHKADTLLDWMARGGGNQRPSQFDRVTFGELKTRRVSVLEAMAANRKLILLGWPGGGKSTFGASVLLALAQTWLGHADQMKNLGEYWTFGTLLPIRVVLRKFAASLPAGDQASRAGDIWQFIADDLRASGYGMSAHTMTYVQRIARTQGALVLFDGLDECGDEAKRKRVLTGVNEFINSAPENCRFVLTARPYAWPSVADPRKGVFQIAELQPSKIDQFIRAWYVAVVARKWLSPGDGELKCQDLLTASHRRDLQPMAKNPLLLTLTAAMHTNTGHLPDDRADLYDKTVELLLLRWGVPMGAEQALLKQLDVDGLKLSGLRTALEKLAFEVHEASFRADAPGEERADEANQPAADIGEDRLIRAFMPLLNGNRDKAAVVVEYIEKRAGLLLGQGEKDGQPQFTFPHRTFQEYLAACHLAASADFPKQCLRLARQSAAHWGVVLPLAARVAGVERGASAADELTGSRAFSESSDAYKLTSAAWGSAAIAGSQLNEIGRAEINSSDRAVAIRERVAGWLVGMLPREGLLAKQRAQAGDILSQLGDPRFDATRFYLPTDANHGFVHIQADPNFRIGTRSADRARVKKIIGSNIDDDEINDAVTPTQAFYIAKFPVTVAQFRAYLEATGLKPGDPDVLRDADTRPVRWVSWHEAHAYCKWLTDAMQSSPAFNESNVARLVRDGGWTVELPTEYEWEKAARGGLVGAVFSWGDDVDPQRANYGDSGVNNTSAVGCFPSNDYGLHDMLGNVWQWTGSAYFDDSYKLPLSTRNALKNKDYRWVVRGGSWFGSADDARCASRGRGAAGARLNLVGFRVVLRSAPVLDAQS
jgi:formylglycine-generating enzyme required for sulfatase activity